MSPPACGQHVCEQLTCFAASEPGAGLAVLRPPAAGVTGLKEPAASMTAIKLSSTCLRLPNRAAAAMCDTLTSLASSCRADSCTPALLPVLSVLGPSRPASCRIGAMPPAAVQPAHHDADLASCSASLSARICTNTAVQPSSVSDFLHPGLRI